MSDMVNLNLLVNLTEGYGMEISEEDRRISIPKDLEKWRAELEMSIKHNDGIGFGISSMTRDADLFVITFGEDRAEQVTKSYSRFEQHEIFGFLADLETLKTMHRAIGMAIKELKAREPTKK